MDDETIRCRRCGADDAPRMARAPFRSELGERIHREICSACWKEWLQHQTLLINHYGLDPRDPKARAFLYEQTEQVLLEGGGARQVDTTQEGNVEW